MFLVATIILSMTVIILAYIRKSVQKIPETQSNEELDKYYSLVANNASHQACYKQLVHCCSLLITEIYNLEAKLSIIEPLFKDRLVSEQTYSKIQKKLDKLSVDRMLLESETISYGKNCFAEARRIKNKSDKTYKMLDDSLFNKKREALESEVFKRLTQ